MSEPSNESSLLALIRLYDLLEARVATLEEQIQQGDGEEAIDRYLDGTPVR